MKPRAMMIAAALGAMSLPGFALAATPAQNKQIVTDFFTLGFVQKHIRQAFMTYVDPGYIQHNPIAPDGRDAAINALEPFLNSAPNYSYEIKHVLADGDLVAVHGWSHNGPADRGSAIVDIVRLKDGKIVEHWDVIQAIPEKSANPHPMF